jgi:hypothetical protein
MKLEIVVDASGLPLGMAAAAANVSENELLMPALDDVPVDLPCGIPVIADKGHDSDLLRGELEAAGIQPIIPHRRNRVTLAERRPSIATLSTPLADRADQRLVALLSRTRDPMGSLHLHVRRAGLLGLHPHGAKTVLKLSLGNRGMQTARG